MAFDDLQAELALLINQMENQPEDRHELYMQIREKLNEMRAFGMPLPEDLVRLEEELEAEFAAAQRPKRAEHRPSDDRRGVPSSPRRPPRLC